MPGLELSPEDFRRLAAEVTDLAAHFLASLSERPAFPRTSGAETQRLFASPAPERGSGNEAIRALPEVFANSRPPGGRFFGYVLGSGEQVAMLGDLLASVLNQNVTAWRSSPAAVTIERTVVGWLAEAIGCQGFTGSLTGGGSSANLMGLAMAREAKAPANARGAQPVVVYASEEIHMSVPKALALLGIGWDNLRTIACNEQFRIRTDLLAAAIAADRKAGKRPIAIVASAGTVNTGAIDPLEELAAIASREDLWLHVDGAYGALAALAVPERFAGLALADSLSLDAHKWLYQPLDCGCLLYRDPASARAAFSHSGDYTRVLNTDPLESFAFFEESMELSRRFRALKLWLSLRYHGLGEFREAIRRDLAHAQRLASAIRATRELELLAPVELSAVCFRHAGADPDKQNAAILRRVIERGRVYFSNATICGQFALRCCFVNHRTTDADVDAIVPEVLASAREVKQGARA